MAETPSRSRFELLVDRTSEADGQLVPMIDGRSLCDLVESFERSSRHDPPGGYAGLAAPWVGTLGLVAYYLGGHVDPWIAGSRRWVLGCGCGEPGCWPLEAAVVVTDSSVTWEQFRQPHRDARDYSGFGPFTFDRPQYDRAVAATAELLQ